MGTQFVFIKNLGRKLANMRMQPPTLGQEKPHLLGNRLASVQQMLESRFFRTVGMASLQRPLELLRITQQDQFLGGLRHGKNIR
jgi:hypothetical protein